MFMALADRRRRESGILLGDAFDQAAQQCSEIRQTLDETEKRSDGIARSSISYRSRSRVVRAIARTGPFETVDAFLKRHDK